MDSFLKDNGFKSRKFLIVLLSIILLTGLSILWGFLLWPLQLFNTIATSIATLALGFCGINAARTALPAGASMVAKAFKTKKETEQTTDNTPP